MWLKGRVHQFCSFLAQFSKCGNYIHTIFFIKSYPASFNITLSILMNSPFKGITQHFILRNCSVKILSFVWNRSYSDGHSVIGWLMSGYNFLKILSYPQVFFFINYFRACKLFAAAARWMGQSPSAFGVDIVQSFSNKLIVFSPPLNKKSLLFKKTSM